MKQTFLEKELFFAIEKGDINKIKILLNAGANYYVKDEDEHLPFMVAAKNGKIICMDFFLKNNYVTNLNEEDPEGLTALSLATQNGHLKAVEYLIEHGAKYSTKKSSLTPLVIAANNGDLEILKYLIKKIKHSQKELSEVFKIASKNGNLNIIKYIMSISSKIVIDTTNFIDIVYSGNIEAVKFFIETNLITDIDEFYPTGIINALIASLYSYNIEVTKYLISKGANIYIKNKYKRTPFIFSAILYDEACKYFLENNLFYDINETDYENKSALMYWLEKSKSNKPSEMILNFIKKGANTSLFDKNGDHILTLAARNQNINIIKWLIEHGYTKNLDTPNNNGDTPLIVSAKNNNKDIYNYLILQGANQTIKNKENKIAGDYITDYNIKEIKDFSNKMKKHYGFKSSNYLDELSEKIIHSKKLPKDIKIVALTKLVILEIDIKLKHQKNKIKIFFDKIRELGIRIDKMTNERISFSFLDPDKTINSLIIITKELNKEILNNQELTLEEIEALEHILSYVR